MTGKQEAGVIDIAVVRTPRISNFTDFNPFESIPGVSLRYVKHPRDLHSPDMIILPGTKNTMGDLIWMRESGMEAAVLKEASRGKLIFGVCGGYQMLGETLSDPHGVENGGSMKGMGLLPMETVFAEKKTRPQGAGAFRSAVRCVCSSFRCGDRGLRDPYGREYPEGECRNSHEDHRQRQR